jgi:hypothetical protein
MQREQSGSVILRSGKWYVSYWERRNVNGVVERKRVTHWERRPRAASMRRPTSKTSVSVTWKR